MAHLIEEYAKSLGVKISGPVVKDHYFPIGFDKYITIHQASNVSSKTYSHYDIVVSLLKPFLEPAYAFHFSELAYKNSRRRGK